MNKILFTFLMMVFAFQVQAQLFVTSKAKSGLISRMDAIESNYVALRRKSNKLVDSYNLAKKKEMNVRNYLSQKSGTDLSKANAKTIAKANKELKGKDAQYQALYKDANKEIRRKRNKFAKKDAEYKSLLESLQGMSKKAPKK